MCEERIACPYCGETILKVARKCKSCGKWITESEYEKRKSEAKESETKTCPYCCQKVPLETKKCPHCGEWIVPKDERNIDSTPSINGVLFTCRILFGVLCIFLSIPLGAIFVPNEPTVGIVSVFLLGILLFEIYMIPSHIAIDRNNPNKSAIVIFNFIFGGTVILWFVALIWAYMGKNDDD